MAELSILAALIARTDLFDLISSYLTNAELLSLRHLNATLWRRMKEPSYWLKMVKKISPNYQTEVPEADHQSVFLSLRLLQNLGLARQEAQAKGIRLKPRLDWNSYAKLRESIQKDSIEVFLQCQFRRNRIYFKEALIELLRKHNRTSFFGVLWWHLSTSQKRYVWYSLSAWSFIYLPWTQPERQLETFKKRDFYLRQETLKKELLTAAARMNLTLLLDHLIEKLIQNKDLFAELILLPLLQNHFYSTFEQTLDHLIVKWKQEKSDLLWSTLRKLDGYDGQNQDYLYSHYSQEIFKALTLNYWRSPDLVLKMTCGLISVIPTSDFQSDCIFFVLEGLSRMTFSPCDATTQEMRRLLKFSVEKMDQPLAKLWLERILEQRPGVSEVFLHDYLKTAKFALHDLLELKNSVSQDSLKMIFNFHLGNRP